MIVEIINRLNHELTEDCDFKVIFKKNENETKFCYTQEEQKAIDDITDQFEMFENEDSSWTFWQDGKYSKKILQMN